jgi:hypothetical protein
MLDKMKVTNRMDFNKSGTWLLKIFLI